MQLTLEEKSSLHAIVVSGMMLTMLTLYGFVYANYTTEQPKVTYIPPQNQLTLCGSFSGVLVQGQTQNFSIGCSYS